MRRLLNAVIFIPLALVFVAFAVANRQLVALSFDPFDQINPAIALHMPLFVALIGVAMLGVLAGSVATWWRQGRWRRRVRQLEAEAARLRDEAEHARLAARGGPRAPEQATPPLMLPPAA